MLNYRQYPEVKDYDAGFPLVAVAIDKDKGSQNALKWAIDNVVAKGQTLTLIHVNTKSSSAGHQDDSQSGYRGAQDPQMKELLLPFRCFCTRKNIHCEDVVLEDTDVAKAIVEFVSQSAIEKLVVGAPSRGGFVRFKSTDISTNISKGAPDFCSVYVISKGKVSSVRNAVRPAPAASPLRAQIQSQASLKPPLDHHAPPTPQSVLGPKLTDSVSSLESESIKSPFSRSGRGPTTKSYAELSVPDSDISFVSSGRPSVDRMYPPRLSNGSDCLDRSFEAVRTPHRSSESYSVGTEFSGFSQSSTGTSWSSQTMVSCIAGRR